MHILAMMDALHHYKNKFLTAVGRLDEGYNPSRDAYIKTATIAGITFDLDVKSFSNFGPIVQHHKVKHTPKPKPLSFTVRLPDNTVKIYTNKDKLGRALSQCRKKYDGIGGLIMIRNNLTGAVLYQSPVNLITTKYNEDLDESSFVVKVAEETAPLEPMSPAFESDLGVDAITWAA